MSKANNIIGMFPPSISHRRINLVTARVLLTNKVFLKIGFWRKRLVNLCPLFSKTKENVRAVGTVKLETTSNFVKKNLLNGLF